MRALILAGLLLLPVGTRAASLPTPEHLCGRFDHLDLNCDGLDPLHCDEYDLDGATYGDCMADGVPDDFWTYYDGDFDGTTNCDDPDDVCLEQPDGTRDGLLENPLCDRFQADRWQSESILFPYAEDPFTFYPGYASYIDVLRGNLAELGFRLSMEVGGEAVLGVYLGQTVCLAAGVPDDLITDPAVPPAGEGFFYVSRFPYGNVVSPGRPAPYGYASCLEREPAATWDCAP